MASCKSTRNLDQWQVGIKLDDGWPESAEERVTLVSPFGFPLHFEGAWVPYEAEKDSYFVQQYGLDTPALVDKSVLRIIMLNA